MSAEYLLFGDYPLSEEEKSSCIFSLAELAKYMFGPAKAANGLQDKTEKVFCDYRYFKLARKVINTETVSDVCIDLSLYIPDNNALQIVDEDEDGQISYRYPGSVREISTILSEGKIYVSHGIGMLIFNEIADVDLTVTNFTDDEPVDPADIGGPVMFSDQLAITEVLVNIQ